MHWYAAATTADRMRSKTRDAVYYATDAQAVARLRPECELRDRIGIRRRRGLVQAHCGRLTGIAGHGAIRTQGSAQFDPYRACLGMSALPRPRARRCSNGRESGASWPTRSRPRCGPAKGRRSRARSHRDGLCDARVSAAGRTISNVSHVRPGDRANQAEPNVTSWACPTSWSGTPSGRTTMRDGHRTIDCCWAAATAWFARSAARQQFARQPRSCARTSKPGCRRCRASNGVRMGGSLRDDARQPALHRSASSLSASWFALGYGGNGMTFGFLAARLLLERWQGGQSRDHDLFTFDRLRRTP